MIPKPLPPDATWEQRAACAIKVTPVDTVGDYTELCPVCHGFQGPNHRGEYCGECGGFGRISYRNPR